MPVLAICPYCLKTIKIERIPRVSCSDCGTEFGFAELQRKHLLVDSRTEAAELVTAKEFFENNEYVSASEHYKRALSANKNSYTAQYYILLCDIYLHEADNGADEEYDAMTAIVNMVKQTALVLSHANVSVGDKLAFIRSMLAEAKAIITRRLASHNDLFENNIEEYRKVSIADLTKLLDLFKIDRELIMSFAPEVSTALTEIVDYAIKTCYKAVQTVAVGEDILSPNDDDYRRISALCNELCFFGNSFSSDFNGSVYSPDFSQNYMLNEKVLSRFAKFDDADKSNGKKHSHLVSDLAEYNSILDECVKALKFTYLNCYRSLCSRQVAQHAKLFFDGFDMLYRLLMPRVVPVDKKKYEVHVPKFADIVDWCDILTRFLVDAYELDEVIGKSLHDFYERLLEVVTEYVIPEMEKLSKYKTDADRLAFQKAVYNCACCCAPALHKYVDFSADADKARNKLVKICKGATEGFLLHSGLSINEIEQSNFYRPILQISTAIMDEYNE